MHVRRLGGLGLAAAVVGAALVALPASPGAAAGPCSATSTRTLSGAQSPFTTTLGANERVNANAATWTGTTPYPVYFDSTADSCWDGGTIKGTWGPATSWNVYHDTTGMGVSGARVTIDHPRVFNYGDGIRIRDNADGFLVKDAYLSYIHDDCIENDRLVSGTVTNSYLDGCYVGFSARRSDGSSFDGRTNTVTISNSLVRLQAMPKVYSGDGAGHGGFFKWDTSGSGTSPKLDISNTIFRADQATNHQDLNLPSGYAVTCSNNTMVWLGPGSFPGSLPPCFTVTTNRSVWDAAARAWDVAHPGVITGPEVSVGDASVLEGNNGKRVLRFPLSLNVAPGTGKSVTVYWATAPGTAGVNDFTTARGKAVFSSAQVHKTISVPVKPDTKDEVNELMYLVVAGIDGGENHRERGTGTIVDDDPGSGNRLAVSDALIVEGDTGTRSLVVPVTLSDPATSDVIVTWTTQATGSATSGADFTSRSGTAKIGTSKRYAMLSIPILADLLSEGTETFEVVVTNATNITVLDGTGVVSIRDDD